MSHHADPGGVFTSDVHRRVLGHLTDEALSVEDLAVRLDPDDHTPFGVGDDDDLVDVLEDLEADGHASRSQAGWKQTKKGLEALGAPVPVGGEG